MNDATLLLRMFANLESFISLDSPRSSSRLLRLEGVTAEISPRTLNCALFNSVVYESPAALERALERLAAAYRDAGVRAWTVWVHESDRDAEALLERAGHRIDTRWAAMARELTGITPPDSGSFDWTTEVTMPTVAEINDRAYGYGGPAFAAALAGFPDGIGHLYLARLECEPASCVMAYDQDGDCGIYLVATLPEARGHGLAGRLLHQALADAVVRGCTTTSLQATEMGYPVYAASGYRDLGQLRMWERRQPGGSPT